MTPAEIPRPLVDYLDQQAGKIHRPGGTVLKVLSDLLTMYDDIKAAEAHEYLSTGCLHGNHEYCKNMRGMSGDKRPARCKFCNAPCICPCHQTDSSPLNSPADKASAVEETQ